jgi:hypothetical protein
MSFMIRAWLVTVLAAAGVWVLAGPGWGLLTAAAAVYVMRPQLTALRVCWAGFRRVWRRFAARVRYSPGVFVGY